jgi:hypothetical protein
MDGSGWVGAQAKQDRGGRFAPGVSGNPAGKRKGTRNRMTILAAALSLDESGEIARAVIDRALAGDHVAARFCLKLLVPKLRSRPIELDLPACNSVEDIVAAFDVTVAAMAAGEITPDEALTVSRVLNRRRRAIEARARRRGREAKRGRDPVRPGADQHSACNSRPSEIPVEPAEHAAAETPPAEQLVADVHSACNFSSRATFAKASETVKAIDAPLRPPLPGFGSACIRPAIRRRTARIVGAMRTGEPAMTA